MFTNHRETFLEINLDNIEHNFNEIKRIVNDKTIIMPVIKANAYGHGSVVLAKKYLQIGAARFAVSILDEAIELRRENINVPILMLNYTSPTRYEEVLLYDLIQTIYKYEDAKKLSQKAMGLGKTAKIHIKIDTGMGRLGFLPTDESIDEILKISTLPNISIEGIFTHFAKADEKDKTETIEQFNKFMHMVNQLEQRGLSIELKHVSNSAAIIDIPEYNLDLARPGIILYGLYPSDEVNKNRINLRPAMTLKSIISNIKNVPTNTGISYGHKFMTKKPSKIATVPIGYADGYTRLLSNKGKVFVNGQLANVVGNICMDQLMIDVTEIQNVNIGDEVVLFGDKEEGYPHVDEIAKSIGTINYEITCMINRRVPRVYIENGKITEIVEYLTD
ncbi:MAG TPA: alanine racemase [Soehngenia sp.]|nr:alanine racemase [Soehngenia sp.]HPP31160.1 alanine racemase [Soehngenia sp.]